MITYTRYLRRNSVAIDDGEVRWNIRGKVMRQSVARDLICQLANHAIVSCLTKYRQEEAAQGQ